jgi:hypothetical protein
VITLDVQEKLKLIREGSYTESPQQVLNEAYYGKNPDLLECEKLMELAVYTPGGDIQSLRKVTAIMKKLFNFSDFVIIPIGLSGPAATIPITTYKFKYIVSRLEMEKSATGIQFKSGDKVQAVIMIGLTDFRIFNLTGEEMVSLILHEIGHSMRMILPSTQIMNAVGAVGFTTAIWPAIVFNFFGGAAVAVGGVVTDIRDGINQLLGSASASVHDVIKKFSYIGGNIASHFMIIKSTIAQFKNASFVSALGSMIKNGAKATFGIVDKISPFGLARALAGFTFNAGKFKEELLADFVATAYGYGPALSSGLGKLTTGMHDMASSPIVRLLSLPANLINTILDPHPNNISRMKKVIESLETELSKGINEKEFSLIKEDLEAAKKELAKYEAEVGKRKLTQFDFIIFRKVMGKLIKGNDDVRALFFGLTPKDLAMMDGLEELPVKTKDPQDMQESIQLIEEAAHIPYARRNQLIGLICED